MCKNEGTPVRARAAYIKNDPKQEKNTKGMKPEKIISLSKKKKKKKTEKRE